MSAECLVSVIVPVYNVELYLRQCVDSILNQDFRDFEMILVDDGSSDSSFAICEEYAAKDVRVKAIRKQNGGASSARNAGLKAASGEYVLFIDGDDFIEENSLGKIMEANDADGACDVVFLKAANMLYDGRIVPSNDVYNKRDYYQKSYREVLAYLAGHDPLPVCVWGKLIRRAVLDGNGIHFTEGIICEDVDFCLKLYMHAKSYNYIDIMYYYYREGRTDSVMTANTDRKYYDLFFIISEWSKLAKGKYREHESEIYTVLAFQYCMLLQMYQNLNKKDRQAQKSNADGLAWLLGCSNDARVRLLNIVYKLSGISGVAGLLYFYNKVKLSAKGIRS